MTPSESSGSAKGVATTAGSGGSRAGLFRTPISGGVQSATSSHGLPHPAIAVRNLIEQVPTGVDRASVFLNLLLFFLMSDGTALVQARFAHLCTIMSRMHHRRRGYPFGSLVDFATDNRGRMAQNLSCCMCGCLILQCIYPLQSAVFWLLKYSLWLILNCMFL